jgi:hypothetical protein
MNRWSVVGEAKNWKLLPTPTHTFGVEETGVQRLFRLGGERVDGQPSSTELQPNISGSLLLPTPHQSPPAR